MADHLDRLDRAVDLIKQTRKEVDGSRIMCQCFHGKHISITILVAYLMKRESMNANEATALIKKTRPKVFHISMSLNNIQRNIFIDKLGDTI